MFLNHEAGGVPGDRIGQRRVHDPIHPGAHGCLERSAMLIDSAPDRHRAYQQQTVAAVEGLRQRPRRVEVTIPHLDSALGELGQVLRVA
jgi:hypothetical protein